VADATGPASGFLRSTFRTTTNPTGLVAGYKHNVIPDAAVATIDVRTLPGQEDACSPRSSGSWATTS
jgi:acetylornithine deacetylase/succinyl-diaminopimelate desuccinylase-like protein